MALLLIYYSCMKLKQASINQRVSVFSLVTLTGQNAMLGLSMRYARTRPGDMFISTTAVFMAELVKLVTCLGLVWNDEDRSVGKWWSALDRTIIKQPMDTVKVITLLNENFLNSCFSL